MPAVRDNSLHDLMISQPLSGAALSVQQSDVSEQCCCCLYCTMLLGWCLLRAFSLTSPSEGPRQQRELPGVCWTMLGTTAASCLGTHP